MSAFHKDRLAEIKARAESFHRTEWLGDGGKPAGILYEHADELADAVLALVEIAEAARGIVWYDDGSGPHISQDPDYWPTHKPLFDALSALARLGSETAEENTK